MKLGRRLGALFGNGSAATDPGADEPCIPCGQQQGVRQFSLNPAPPRVIDDDLRLALTTGPQYAVVDGQVVLYDPPRTRSHVLNPSAAAVWASVDGQRTVTELIDLLQADTGADRAVLDRDVRTTLAQFLDSQIVTEVADAPTAPVPGAVPGAAAEVAGVQLRGADRWAATVTRLLDALDWTTAIGPARAGGIDLVARTNDATVGRLLHDALAALPPAGSGESGDPVEPVVISVHDPGSGRARRLYVDGRRQWSDPEPTALVEAVLEDLTQRVLAGTPGQLRLHAGAVERDGRVVAVAGFSGRGKSTLTAALVQRGFAYVTDEVTVVDPRTLEVSPYAKALDLDGPALALLGMDPLDDASAEGRRDDKGRRAVPVPAFGATSSGGRLALVVLLDDEILDGENAGASEAVRDVLDLIGITFRESFADELALDQLAAIAASVPSVRIARAPLDQMADQVESALGR